MTTLIKFRCLLSHESKTCVINYCTIMLYRWSLLVLAGTRVSYLDVTPQSPNRKVFWAVGTLLPDALVNSFDVVVQIGSCKQFWTVWTFLLDALVNVFDVLIQNCGFKLLWAVGTLLSNTIMILLDVS